MSEPIPSTLPAIAQHLRDDVNELPMLPSVVLRLSMLDPQSPSYFDEVNRMAHADPGFAVRLLRMANSAGGGALHAAPSIDMALIRVGARAAVELMLAENATRVFPAKERWQRDLWAHSILVATYMRRLAPMVVGHRLDANQAYLAGLLHDIGRFLMFSYFPEAFEIIEDAGWDAPQGLIEAEMRICGCTHTQLAHWAMQRWGLPEALALAARDHHRDEAVQGEPLPDAEVGALVGLLRDVDWLAMHVARDGVAWLQQSPEEFEARAARHMRSHYRGDAEHRLAMLRSATADVHGLLAALGLQERDADGTG